MSYRVVVRRNAELDIVGAMNWYEEQRMGLGSDFYAQFSRTIERLADSPLIYPVVYREVRRAVLHRFPYPRRTGHAPRPRRFVRPREPGRRPAAEGRPVGGQLVRWPWSMA